MQLICETLFSPRMSVTITFLTYSSYTSQSTGISLQFSPKFNRSPPSLNRFTSGVYQNYLLFKGYKVSYNRKCPPTSGPISKFSNSTLKTGEASLPLLGEGAGSGDFVLDGDSPSNTKSPGPRPSSILSGILMHAAVCPQ